MYKLVSTALPILTALALVAAAPSTADARPCADCPKPCSIVRCGI